MNDCIKVLQVFGSLNMGGAENRMMDVYRHLDREKCSFDFLTLSKEKQYFEDEILNMGGRIIKIQSPRKAGLLKHFSQLRKIMRENKYDAVHAHTSYHCGIVMLAARLERIPVRISHSRTTGSKKKSLARKAARIAGSLLVNIFSTKRVAISKDAGNFLFGNKQFEVIPNAIDLEKYNNVDQTEINKIRSKLALQSDAFVIGQIGRFDNMKNHAFTVEWFAQYVKTNPNSVLVFVGDGVLRPGIEEKVKELNIQNNVIFMGIRSDVNVILNVFNVLFFPSKYEGLGGVVIEAQAAGIPCVESDNIPTETDLGLDLITRKSLNESFEEWNSAVDSCKNAVKPDWQARASAFNEKGYSLSAEIDKLLKIYGNK